VEQTIEVKPSYGLTDQEVERMLIESFEHAETDIEMRLLIEARNEAETVIHATEKSLRRQDFEQLAAEVFEPGERARIDAALTDAKQAIGAADRARVQQTTEALNQATRHLAEVVMNRSVREALAGKNVKDA
jgi:molecular chaperone DnaK (HSP70)